MFRAAQHQDPADGRPSMTVEDIELLPAADLERWVVQAKVAYD